MRIALIVLAAVAVVLVLVGAFNADLTVHVDLLAGSLDVSLFWLSVIVAGGIALAAVAGWTLGRIQGGDRRRKLERELEATYRRLREAEAKPQPSLPAPTIETPVGAAVPLEARTLEQPAEAATVERPVEPVTVVQPAEQATSEYAAGEAEQPAEGDSSQITSDR